MERRAGARGGVRGHGVGIGTSGRGVGDGHRWIFSRMRENASLAFASRIPGYVAVNGQTLPVTTRERESGVGTSSSSSSSFVARAMDAVSRAFGETRGRTRRRLAATIERRRVGVDRRRGRSRGRPPATTNDQRSKPVTREERAAAFAAAFERRHDREDGGGARVRVSSPRSRRDSPTPTEVRDRTRRRSRPRIDMSGVPREYLVFRAKLAQQCGRDEDMLANMRLLAAGRRRVHLGGTKFTLVGFQKRRAKPPVVPLHRASDRVSGETDVERRPRAIGERVRGEIVPGNAGAMRRPSACVRQQRRASRRKNSVTARVFWLKCSGITGGTRARSTPAAGRRRTRRMPILKSHRTRAPSAMTKRASARFIPQSHRLTVRNHGKQTRRARHHGRVFTTHPRGDRVDGGLGRTRGYRSRRRALAQQRRAVARGNRSRAREVFASTSPSARIRSRRRKTTHTTTTMTHTTTTIRAPTRARANPSIYGVTVIRRRRRRRRLVHAACPRDRRRRRARVDARTIDARATCSWSRTIVDDDGDRDDRRRGSSLPIHRFYEKIWGARSDGPSARSRRSARTRRWRRCGNLAIERRRARTARRKISRGCEKWCSRRRMKTRCEN